MSCARMTPEHLDATADCTPTPRCGVISSECHEACDAHIRPIFPKHMKIKILAAVLLWALGCVHTSARDLAVKTNLLYDAALTVNAGAELQVSPRWSVDLSGNLNAWTLDEGKKWKHWLVQPEARWWSCERFCEALGGHFVAGHLLGGQYNAGHLDLDFKLLGTDFGALDDHRYQGWFGGVGVAYGYSWLLGRHWNLEAELGIGWIHTRFDRYECAGCGRAVGSGRHNYFGPTKAALNLVYVF